MTWNRGFTHKDDSEMWLELRIDLEMWLRQQLRQAHPSRSARPPSPS